MNKSDYTLVGFEIIGLERIGQQSPQRIVENITDALQHSGFDEIPQVDKSKMIKFFNIRDKAFVKQFAKKNFADCEEELVWLATEYFEDYFIFLTKHDLLFGFASTSDPEQVGPYGRPPHYILSEVGDNTYRPSIPRILISSALIQNGFHELGKSLECATNFPRETALAGDIIFVNYPIKYDLKINLVDKGYELRSLSILSSKLLTQEIVGLLQDESKLSEVEIAKALPLQIFSVAVTSEEEHPFNLFNHFSIRARKGTFGDVISELLGVSLHLNWSIAKEHAGKLSREEAISYALIQNSRLKQVEDKEQRLNYALNVLQRRYLSHKEIIEWEVNNLYSNIVRFSPVYLSYKVHLQAFIQNIDQFSYRFSNMISQLDWNQLEKNGIAGKDEGERIIELLRVDPPSTLIKMRVIIEKIVSLVFLRQFPSSSPKISLAEKLRKLGELNTLPPFIGIYLNTLRLTGNIGAHESVGTREDIEAVLPIFLRVVEWFLDKELQFE